MCLLLYYDEIRFEYFLSSLFSVFVDKQVFCGYNKKVKSDNKVQTVYKISILRSFMTETMEDIKSSLLFQPSSIL